MVTSAAFACSTVTWWTVLRYADIAVSNRSQLTCFQLTYQDGHVVMLGGRGGTADPPFFLQPGEYVVRCSGCKQTAPVSGQAADQLATVSVRFITNRGRQVQAIGREQAYQHRHFNVANGGGIITITAKAAMIPWGTTHIAVVDSNMYINSPGSPPQYNSPPSWPAAKRVTSVGAQFQKYYQHFWGIIVRSVGTVSS
jgi:hypothetical protein